MVGVARIELATPAMSRQGHSHFFAKNSRFLMFSLRNTSGTENESRAVLPQFYRTPRPEIEAEIERLGK